jgi:uncharacterized protein
MARLKKILAIDGGGIRGILSGEILVALEKKLQLKTHNENARLSDFFDFFAGTSTGAILIFIYLFPHKNEKLKANYTAQDAVNLYLENAKNIFKPNYLTSALLKGKINSDKYSVKGLEIVLQSYFQQLRLSDLIKPCIIPTYDLLRRQAYFFSQVEAVKDPANDFFLKDAARSTSAAPGFFAPAQVTSMSGVSYLFADGGIFAHNPAVCAFTELKRMPERINPEEMLFVSIGSGSIVRAADIGNRIDISSVSKKIKPKEVMAAGVAEPVDLQMRQIFEEAGASQNYFRINPKLGKASAMMDDASPRNLAALKEAGEYNAKKSDEELEILAERLLND